MVTAWLWSQTFADQFQSSLRLSRLDAGSVANLDDLTRDSISLPRRITKSLFIPISHANVGQSLQERGEIMKWKVGPPQDFPSDLVSLLLFCCVPCWLNLFLHSRKERFHFQHVWRRSFDLLFMQVCVLSVKVNCKRYLISKHSDSSQDCALSANCTMSI